MRCRIFSFVVAMCCLTASAMANNVVVSQGLTGDTAFFGALHTDNVDFEDEFTFTVPGNVMANLSLITIGGGFQNIDFLSAELNSVPLTLTPNGFVEQAFTPTDLNLTGPLVLKVKGKSGSANGVYASYSGTLNVKAVPEPAMGLMGLMAAVGSGLAWRRRRTG